MKKPGPKISVEITAYYLCLGDDEIIRARVKDNATVDLKEAVEMTDAIKKISPDCSRPLIVHLGKMNFITKEARDHFKGENRTPTSPAVALITHTRLSIMIGNFYMLFNKPRVPTRLFSKEVSALKWLKKYL